MSDTDSNPKELDCRLVLLRAFSSTREYPFTDMKDEYPSRVEYYKTMCANVLAEAVAAFRVASRTRFSLKCSEHREGGWLQVQALENQENDEGGSELELMDNVLEYKGEIYWVCAFDFDPISQKTFIQGLGLRGRLRLDKFEGWREARRSIFGGDYCSRYRCALHLQSKDAKVPALEEAVLRPSRQAKGTYPECGRVRTEVLRINTRQYAAVTRLQNRLELIHGPPGTGKSTTIFHILASKLPKNEAAVVTCVTNQAIDAVAEKLEVGHNLPGGEAIGMLVLGNPKRLGETAGKYTLEKLMERDPLVRTMKVAVRVLERISKLVSNLQQARLARLTRRVRDHHRSRETEAALRMRPYLRRMMEEAQRGGIQKTATQCRVEVVNRVKNKMIAAVLRGQTFKLAQAKVVVRRKFTRLPSKLEWDINSFEERVQAALERAYLGLNLMLDTAAERVVRSTRAILCTIASAHKVAKLRREFGDCLPSGLFMGILDEAAATAETYVPLLIDLGIQHLVMLGDHKQLSPLVMAEGGEREFYGQNVDRSLMERAMQNGVKQHSLTEQYRMPKVLCDLVSALFYQDDPLQTGHSKRFTRNTLRWIQVDQLEEDVGKSKANVEEVLEIHCLLSFDPVLSRPDSKIMIIALYKPQAALIKAMVEKFFQGREIRVVTVDAAQGSEERHLILSTVRCNRNGDIGFATSPRRLCVALSRAQESLTIVGSLSTFTTRGSDWGNWRRVESHFKSYGSIQQGLGAATSTARTFVEQALKDAKPRFQSGEGWSRGPSHLQPSAPSLQAPAQAVKPTILQRPRQARGPPRSAEELAHARPSEVVSFENVPVTVKPRQSQREKKAEAKARAMRQGGN